jgi:hypothetical protein
MDLQEIIRKYFRINVKGNDAFSIKVNNVPYELLEIGDTGIGIKLTSEDIFFTVEDKLPIELKAEDQVYNFQGKVIHISPSGPEDFLCGIEFMNVDKDTQTKWMNFVQSSREKIFKEE